MSILDVERVRADFPFFGNHADGDPPLVYLDSAATSLKPQAVIDAVQNYDRHLSSNVSRGGYALARATTGAYEEARAKVAEFIHAASPEEVVFTKNATEALNLVANVLAWADQPHRIGRGDGITLTEMEHVSNIIPWQLVAEHTGAVVTYLGITDDGRLDLSRLDEQITARTKAVGITHVSNTLGSVNPVSAVVARARQVGALVVLDCSQSAPHLDLDVRTLGADLVVFTGHKICGPTGVGVLWGRRELLVSLPPFLGGGSMTENVTCAGSRFTAPPWRFEAGTPPIAQAIGLGAAVDYLSGIGMRSVTAHNQNLADYALKHLQSIDGLHVVGPVDTADRAPIVSFVIDDTDADELGELLDNQHVAVRVGRQCAHLVCARFKVPTVVRASFHLYNDTDDVDALVSALRHERTPLDTQAVRHAEATA
ncbi:aminotransferase class V-fold PLP-dependent enzyme [Catenulispora rubra]|uniref:aminotransferase class V-fold PLP-dependent enzyme n=1 Tax=Catenulispora rubra TaxID=280293 RepID=UPI00189219A7|nr:SufS family cysteine desulfurase [Catenulispora rubra]